MRLMSKTAFASCMTDNMTTSPIASLPSPSLTNDMKAYETRATVAATPIIRCFCAGVSSMCAGLITHPIDVIKVRMQLDNQGKKSKLADRYYRGFFRGVVVITKDEGIRGLYKGIGASMLREGIYSTVRLGLYEPFKELLNASGPHAVLWKKVLAGVMTGTIAGVITTPADLVKIRMQGQGKLKPGEQPRYVNTLNAFSSIIKEGGIIALWCGVIPTVVRAAMVSATQIPAYDHTKQLMKQKHFMDEGLKLHFVAAFTAGLMTSIVTSPIDVVKTRTMNEKTIPECCAIYSRVCTSFVTIFQSEGILGFYKGFIPNWVRIGPHTMITFLVFEQLRKVCHLEPV